MSPLLGWWRKWIAPPAPAQGPVSIGDVAGFDEIGALLEAGRVTEAESLLEGRLEADPDDGEAHGLLGLAAARAGRLGDAERHLRAALDLQPERAEANGNLGNVLRDLGRLDEAEPLLRRAVDMAPDAPEPHCNLGNLLADRNRLEEAGDAFERALARVPDFAVAHNALGNVRRREGRLADAGRCYDAALEAMPGFAQARWNRALLRLLEGDYARAWPDFEARFELGAFARLRAGYRALPAARWEGTRFEGRSLLVWAEQGFGDTLQFVRYLPLVKALGGEVVLECQPALGRLLDGVPGADLVRAGDDPRPGPPCDLQVPLLSLPGLFGTTRGSIPAAVPYLRADPALAASWRARLHGDALRVGLVWAGKPDPDPNRSMRLADAAPLAEVPGVVLHSLQVGPGVGEIAQAPAGRRPVDLGSDFGDFADTAAAIAGLDLVVTIDTAVAHLAGALGRPVWALLPFAPDWRWQCGGDDSPWYPTMRLFRQHRAGDWSRPVAAAAAALARGDLTPAS